MIDSKHPNMQSTMWRFKNSKIKKIIHFINRLQRNYSQQ